MPIVYGADTLLFSDDFSDEASGWGTGSNAGGTVAYASEGLRLDPAAVGAWIWSRRTDDETWNVMRVEANLQPSASGYQGLMCAAGDDELFGVVINDEGRYAFVRLTASGVEILFTDQNDDFVIEPGFFANLALDCAGTATGPLRLQVSMPFLGTSASHEVDDGSGPAGFDRAAVYAEAGAEGYSLIADDVDVYGGTEYTGDQPASAADALLAHVPEAWQQSCQETTPSASEPGATGAVACGLSGEGAEIAEYVQFDSKASMDAAYQQRLANWGSESTGLGCQIEPSEFEWTVDGVETGFLFCAEQPGGIRFDWTDDRLNILSSLTDFDSSYRETYRTWETAGPNL